jgi:ABC-type Co2+ transport system permease subunit
MHIEPGLVDGTKIVLSYATAAAAGTVALKAIARSIGDKGMVSLTLRSLIATVGVFAFFEVLPHFPVGVSEVHFILGSTLFLILGAAPSAIGMALGLLIQGLFFSPTDLPQYAMNLTTLLVPLFLLQSLAKRIIAPGTAYVDLKYSQALALSSAYQGGVVGWVAFWAIYGGGFGAQNITAVASFGAAYALVILVEPLIDLAVLAAAKLSRTLLDGSPIVTPRLFQPA